MILLTNGCSWTWGGGLGLETGPVQNAARLKSVWPAHLGKLLKASEVINLAAGCASNQRIVRTTLDWILNQTEETLSQTIAIIQWTDLSRFEYYNPKNLNEHYENKAERWAMVKIDCVIDHYEEDMDYNSQRMSKRFETYTEIEGLYMHISHCAALSNVFKKFNVKYYYWTYKGYYPNCPINLYNFLKSFNWLKNSEQWNYERVSSDDLHPNLQGHKDISNIIYQNIKEYV